MKIMVISDEPCQALWESADPQARLQGIDLILSCGDLPRAYLEYLATFTTVPILYVHGNHDGRYGHDGPGGCVSVEDTVYNFKGLRIVGLGGSIRYTPRHPYQFTEKQMSARIRKLRFRLWRSKGCDILLAHSPALNLNDGKDPPHRGFDCFHGFLGKYKPKYFIHGHNHMRYDANLPRTCMYGETTVINASERYIFEIPDPE